MNTYDLFSGEELLIAERIQQRRLQLLVHSCLYYHLNTNLISDMQWDKWAKELVQLQNDYPHIADKVWLSTNFKDWDASTGAFLPITEDWVIKIAKSLTSIPRSQVNTVNQTVKKKAGKKRLF